MKSRILLAAGLTMAVAVGPSAAFAQDARVGVERAEPPGLEPTGADMPAVGGNLANQHYSGLKQITKRNLGYARSVLRGRHCRSSPSVFSLLPRCHGEYGSQK